MCDMTNRSITHSMIKTIINTFEFIEIKKKNRLYLRDRISEQILSFIYHIIERSTI